jgi:hypothetical protein
VTQNPITVAGIPIPSDSPPFLAVIGVVARLDWNAIRHEDAR